MACSKEDAGRTGPSDISPDLRRLHARGWYELSELPSTRPRSREGDPHGRAHEGRVVAMDITDIRIFPVEEEKLKAFVSVIFDDCFVVSDIKIIQGANGLFVSMPSKKRKNGTFRDIAHPLNNETRRRIEEKVLHRYQEMVESGRSAGIRPLPEDPKGPKDDEDPVTWD